MNNRKEKLLASIKTAGFPKEEDRKELASLLNNPVLQRMLYGILLESDNAITAMANSDLRTEEGVRAAILLQAQSRCYSAVVEDLVEYVTTEEQPETPEGE